jgi:hypothetical protein
MTEQEWLGQVPTDFPDIALNAMLDEIAYRASSRKLRLFACACCRRVWHFLGENSRRPVFVAERFADGKATVKELSAARDLAYHTFYDSSHATAAHKNAAGAPICAAEVQRPDAHPVSFAGEAAMSALDAFGADYFEKKLSYDHYRTEAEMQVSLLRDIIGNPFRSVSMPAAVLAWNDGIVPRLAQDIYDERTFDRLPILAEALEDADFHDADILGHCRLAGSHVLGCWVVDLVLGKN